MDGAWITRPIYPKPSMTPASDQLIDSFGRVHNNLRISVTDRCNIRCVYCMPETVTFLPRASLLTFEEIERFVRVAATLGIDKIRLTGGEPLVRRDLPRLVAQLVAIPGIKDVGLTTNGILLAPWPRHCGTPGLRRINISLDTMDPRGSSELTRRDGLRTGDRGDSRGQGGRIRPGEDQRRRDQGRDRGRRRPAGRFAPRARAGAAVHRVHAARRRPSLGAREGPLRGGDPRPARRSVSAR